uniref:Uncharacterized protein n=1 Tax=Panagrolaimus davidi TaxID=227884 RepID=A0A914QQE2_9BILA
MLLLTSIKTPAFEPLRSLLLNALIKDPKTDLEAVTTLLDNVLMTEREQKLPEERQAYVVRKIQPQQQRHSGSSSYRRRTSSAASTSSRGSHASSIASKRLVAPRRGTCFSCAGDHRRSSCRFRDAECNACGGFGHIQKVCINNASNSKPRVNTVRVNTVHASTSRDYGNPNDDTPFRVNCVRIASNTSSAASFSGASSASSRSNTSKKSSSRITVSSNTSKKAYSARTSSSSISGGDAKKWRFSRGDQIHWFSQDFNSWKPGRVIAVHPEEYYIQSFVGKVFVNQKNVRGYDPSAAASARVPTAKKSKMPVVSVW